jgi:hypothetical protein
VRPRSLAILSPLAAALVLTASGLALPPPSRDTLILPYWEARAAGLVAGTTPAGLGIAECQGTPDPGFDGFRTAEEAEEAADLADSEPVCRADPTRAVIGIGPPWREEPASPVTLGLDRAGWYVRVGGVWTSIAAWRLAGSPRLASSWPFRP